MSGMLLCEPNVSEGRDAGVVAAIADAVRETPGVKLIHCSSDPDHNRSVLAYLGSPEAVLAASRAMAAVAFERIDMRKHEGAHPRLGAVDVAPFVRLLGASLADALSVCRRFGAWAGESGVPVYYYEEAATRPERRSIPDIRRGEYEGLEARLADPEWAPDEGPTAVNPGAGAVIAGVRGPLVRLNVNLATTDAGVARDIARAVRGASGGLPHVRALGFALEHRGLVQVSMNLIRPDETPASQAVLAVREEARRRGVSVAGAELIGPVPLDTLLDVARDCLDVPGLEAGQVLESALLDAVLEGDVTIQKTVGS